MIENQKNIFNLLKQSKQNDRLSHAYLFYGDEGVGKKELAYALACLFYCEHGGCLECETCKTILSGQHLNVDYIGTLETKKLISKEQIVELQEEFSKQASEIINVLGTMIYCEDILSENGELYFVYSYRTPDLQKGDTPGVFFKYDEQSGKLLYIGCAYDSYLTHVYKGKII